MNTADFCGYLHSRLADGYPMITAIAEELAALGVDHRTVASGGVLARIEGRRGNVERSVVLVATVKGATEQPCADKSKGESIKPCSCSLYHASMLYGVLKQCQSEPDFEGTLFALFQPAVVDGKSGARSVLAEDLFKGYNVAAVLSQRVDATLTVGEIGFCPGRFMPSADELHFAVKGVGGNVAERNRLKDSVVAMADLIVRLNTFNSDVCMLSVGHVEAAGEAMLLPEECRCSGSMFAYDENLRSRLKDMIAHAAEEVEYKYDVEVDMNIREIAPCVDNNTHLTYEAMLLADSCGFVVRDVERQAQYDDFGYYSQCYPSLCYRLGVSRSADRMHASVADLEERALAVGEEFMCQVALNILNK